eukprot:170652-Prymnesium_polylepis.2
MAIERDLIEHISGCEMFCSCYTFLESHLITPHTAHTTVDMMQRSPVRSRTTGPDCTPLRSPQFRRRPRPPSACHTAQFPIVPAPGVGFWASPELLEFYASSFKAF